MKKRIYDDLCDPLSWQKEAEFMKAKKARQRVLNRNIKIGLILVVIIGALSAVYAEKQNIRLISHQPPAATDAPK